MTTQGETVRSWLGEQPHTIAQLYRRWREVRPRRGTYRSFSSNFYVLLRLGWVERTGETEPAHLHGSDAEHPGGLSDSVYYRLTPVGAAIDPAVWRDPMGRLYPQHAAANRGAKAPTGKPPGRPKKPQGAV